MWRDMNGVTEKLKKVIDHSRKKNHFEQTLIYSSLCYEHTIVSRYVDEQGFR